MNCIERYFRRRALRRILNEEDVPAALRDLPIGHVVAIAGYNYRVVHKRWQEGGKYPGLVLAPVGPTRRKLKVTRARLKDLLRRSA